MIPEGELRKIRPEQQQTHPMLLLPQRTATIVTWYKGEVDKLGKRAGKDSIQLKVIREEKDRRRHGFLSDAVIEARALAHSIEQGADDPDGEGRLTEERDEMMIGLILSKAITLNTPATMQDIKVAVQVDDPDEEFHNRSDNKVKVRVIDPNDPLSKAKEVTLESDVQALSVRYGNVTGAHVGADEFYEGILRKAAAKKTLPEEYERGCDRWEIDEKEAEGRPVWDITQKALSNMADMLRQTRAVKYSEGFEHSMLQPIYDEANRKQDQLWADVYEMAANTIDADQQEELALGILLAQANLRSLNSSISGILITINVGQNKGRITSESSNQITVQIRDPQAPKDQSKIITLTSNLHRLTELFKNTTGREMDTITFYKSVVDRTEPRKVKTIEEIEPLKKIWEFDPENPQTHPVWQLSKEVVTLSEWQDKEIKKAQKQPAAYRQAVLQPIRDELDSQTNELFHEIRERAIGLNRSLYEAATTSSPQLDELREEQQELALEVILAYANAQGRPVSFQNVDVFLHEYFEREKFHPESANKVTIELRDPDEPENDDRTVVINASLFSLSSKFGDIVGKDFNSDEFFEEVLKKVKPKREHESSDNFINRRLFELGRIHEVINDPDDENEKEDAIRMKRRIFIELTDVWVKRQQNEDPGEQNVDMDIIKKEGDRLEYIFLIKGRRISFSIPTYWIRGETARSLILREGGAEL